ncbi:hypothetical protein LOTGIDRAFT_85129, partial [Lottia gigantea]
RFDGFMIDVINDISGLVGFDYRIRPTPDGRYGHKLPDSTWTGMIGDVIRGGADVAVGPLQITLEREKVVDFSKPVITSGTQLLVKRPELPYSDIKDLMNQDEVYVGVVRDTFQEKSVERMQSLSGFGLWDYVKRKNSFLDSYEEGITQVKNSDGKYALVVDQTDGAFITGKHCDVALFGELFNSINLAFACRKGSGICDKLSQGILSMRETGRIKLIYDKWFHSGVC